MPCVFCYSKQSALPFSPDPPMVPAVLADRDAPSHHLVAPGRRTLSLPLRLLRPNHRQKQQLERPYPPANQQPPRQAVARQPAFANQLHPHVTAAAAWTFHAKHTLSFVDLHPLYRMYAAFAITFPAFRTARVFLFIFLRDIRRHRCADFLRRTPRNRLIHRPRRVLPNHKVVDVCLLQHIPC